jgi:YD repeat-containing protein
VTIRSISIRKLWAMFIAALVAGLATPAFPQGIQQPPHQDSRSPTGVSYGTGTFSYVVHDLSIGGTFPQGLTLDRTYISNYGGYMLGAHGWTHNLSGSVISYMLPVPIGGQPWFLHREPWVFNVTVGGHSVGFRGGSSYPPTTGGPVGPYTPITPSGATLVYTGTTSTNGRYIFTDSDGSVIEFPISRQPLWIQDWTMADGTRLDFGYDPVTGQLRSVISNRGYAILFQPATFPNPWIVCAVNMTQYAITSTSACPAGVQSVSYGYAHGTYNPSLTLMTSVTDANGNTTTYGYVTPDRLGCITLPGQSTCQIQNSYTLCYELDDFQQPIYRGEYIASQSDAAGATYSYNFQFDFGDPPRCSGVISSATTLTVNGTVVTHADGMNMASLPGSITDPLGRTTSYAYESGGHLEDEPAQLADITYPLGNGVDYYYDARGNLIRQVTRAVPGSGLPDLQTTAVYPTTCTNQFTCNKATSVTDANGNTTDYTFDPSHGGVLSETGAAVNGVRPQTRHEYAQRYAWIMASGGGYVRASTPVWVQTATSLCRTSAATGNPAAPCATAGDEVRTAYDYGPDSGPNNLLLRGQTVTATDNGVTTTLRTCYGYDVNGRRISETQPNANLGSCP